MSEISSEAAITREIRQLSAYLGGVPRDLRERGLFDAYETRLAGLEEELLSAKLSSLISQAGIATERVEPRELVNDARRLQVTLKQMAAVESMHLGRVERLIQAIRIVNWAVAALAVAILGLAGSWFVFGPERALIAIIGGTMASVMILSLFVRPEDRLRKEQEAADRVELLRRELETFAELVRHPQSEERLRPSS